MKKLIYFLIIATLAACHNASDINSNKIETEDQDSITGGQVVEGSNNRFKSVVGLRMVREGSSMAGLCTGTLIRNDIVLTAAHCLVSDKEPWQHIFVVFDNNIQNVTAKTARMGTKAIVHNLYKDGLSDNSYDIALLQFEGGLPAGYQAAPLLNSQMKFESGTPLTIVGYGVNSVFRKTGSGTLRHANVRLANPNATRTEFRINQWIRGICMGDSGGPAFVNVNGVDYVAGVSNRTLQLSFVHCIISGYFARVDRFEDWIRNNLKSLKAQ